MKKRKRCYTCRKLKEASEFPPSPRHKRGLYPYCKPGHAAYQASRKPNRNELDQKYKEVKSLSSQGLKRCTKCRLVKPMSDFYTDTRHTDGKQARCRLCFTWATNGHYLMKEYSLTVADVEKLFEFQKGLCAICKKPPKKNRFNIDHDHKTHVIRALLCVNCNTNLLPYVEYQGEAVKAAFLYLEDPPAPKVLGTRFVPETNQARQRGRNNPRIWEEPVKPSLVK